MPASTKSPEGSLPAAAAALEGELRQYEETTKELERLPLNSDKTIQRARRALESCAAHQEKLASLLSAFALAMGAAQARQQECVETTALHTAKIKARFEERMALLERVAALGQLAQSLHEPIAAVGVERSDDASGEKLLASLEDVSARTAHVISEADSLHQAAQDGDWIDIARDVHGLKQQLEAARNKVLVAQRSAVRSAPS